MPHRLVSLGIVLFWLTMTGLLIKSELVPLWTAADPPIAQIDLTDEIASPLVGWEVFKKNERVGSARSSIRKNDDRTYDFHASYTFDKFNIGMLRVNKMEHVYKVGEGGKQLLAVNAKFWFNLGGDQQPAFPVNDNLAEMQGEVEDQHLEPRFFINGHEDNRFALGKIDMRNQGSIVNAMLPVNRVRGLHEGQSWLIAPFDPFRGVMNKFMPGFLKPAAEVPPLIASVSSDTLFWDKKLVPCLKIEYNEPGKAVTARTWTRKHDGLVLQQEASRDGFDLVLKRVPQN